MLNIAKALVIAVARFELSDEEQMDPDFAVEALEEIGMFLQECSSEEKKALRNALASLQKEGLARTKEQKEFLKSFMENFGI